MFLFTYTAAVLTIIFLITAAFLFVKGRKDALTRIFILYILSGAVWIGGNAIADIAQNDSVLIFSSGVALAGSTFIATFFLIFVDTFIDEKIPSTSRLIAYTVPSILLTIFSFSEYAVIETIYPTGQPAQIVPGIHYYFFLVFLFGSLTYVLIRLIKLFTQSSGTRRLQTLYIGIGFLSLFIGGVTFDLVLPLQGELRFFNLGPQFSLLLVAATAYAIYKHNLLDIRRAVQRGFIYTLLLFFIGSIYLTAIGVTGFLLQQITQTAIVASAGVTTLVGIFTVPYIDRYLRAKTDPFFFKGSYDYAQALYSLSEKINRQVLVEDIVEMIQGELTQILKTEDVRVSFVPKNGDVRDVHEEPHDRKTLKVPIVLDNAHIGTIFLGEKKSGENYRLEDEVLIKTFSHHIALAFEKARLFKEVQEYSEELEKRVAKRTAELQQMREAQTQMMLDISHTLQNPLTIMKAQLSLLRKQSPDRELSFFDRTLEDVSAFIYDLLHLARYEQSVEHPKEPGNLSEHMQELCEYYQTVGSQRQIQVHTKITPNIYFTYNKKELEELLSNLVSNAMKYMGDRTREIHIELSEDATGIRLSVADTGIGIREEDLPHIFERFYRTKTTEQSKISGTGLGLAISKKIVGAHNGTITVESILGKGTTFTVYFPS